ncbi:MAG: acyl carrier protein [Deltaproteobacteria bacterium]|nr:acyl carrier protein [Deltaproteobacteria bacterium]
MKNREKLKNLLIDTFLLDPAEFRFDLKRAEVETWDSLGVVTVAVGIEQVFGYHFTPEEATGVQGVQDIIDLLTSKGIRFDE